MKCSELYDVFIGHDSEDKDEVARPIYGECEACGVKAFLDEKYIKWGDSLTEKINAALGKSRFFLAILSIGSIHKSWPMKELNSAIAREISGEQKVLPLIVGDKSKILRKIPLLADKLYIEWKDDPKMVAREIKELKNKSQ